MDPHSRLADRLLEAARSGHDPSPDDLDATLRALHGKLAFSDLPPSGQVDAPEPIAAARATDVAVGGKLAAAGSGKVIKLVLATMALGGGITGTVLMRQSTANAPPPRAPFEVAETRSPKPATSPIPTTAQVTPAQPSAPTDKAAHATHARRGGSELRLIGRALTELRDADPERALALLQRHAARFPRGAFATEREGLKVLALCAAGRIEEGRRAQAAFLRTSESAPIAVRVRLACAQPVRDE